MHNSTQRHKRACSAGYEACEHGVLLSNTGTNSLEHNARWGAEEKATWAIPRREDRFGDEVKSKSCKSE